MKRTHALLPLLAVALHAGTAAAVDGVLEINQTCAALSGCFPGDTAGFPVTIDPTTGAATSVGSTGLRNPTGLAFDPTSGTLFGVDNTTGELVTIDPTTGAATVVGATGFRNIQGLAFAVPTPGAAAVLGLGGLFAARRRRP